MTLCLINAGHGELVPREYMHPRWHAVVRAWRCQVCGRAWLFVMTKHVELDTRVWKGLADVDL